jgi:pyranose oxidase
MLAVLREEFAELPEGFGPGILPVAGDERSDGTVRWTGADTVLAQLLDPASAEGARFELRPLTLARELRREDGRVTGVLLEDAISGEQTLEAADVVVVAADALRTPQLLWASGIRPAALGHYLTEHPTVVSRVALRAETMRRFATADDLEEERRRRDLNPADPVSGVIRIPYSEPGNRLSAQIMFTDRMPFGADTSAPPPDNEWGYANVGAGLRKFPRFEDAVTFDDDELDYRGFPNMTIRYALTEREEAEIAAAVETITRAATALGDFVPGSEPRVLPNGSSFHYMGTMRIGEADDGTSVCAVDSRVWGFENLYLGGNGLIPTANFVNPTLTSVALAVLGVESIVAGLR